MPFQWYYHPEIFKSRNSHFLRRKFIETYIDDEASNVEIALVCEVSESANLGQA